LLSANRPTVVIYLLINAAALIRVAASWSPETTTVLIVVSGACWILAFGLFEIRYSPMLLAPRIKPN